MPGRWIGGLRNSPALGCPCAVAEFSCCVRLPKSNPDRSVASALFARAAPGRLSLYQIQKDNHSNRKTYEAWLRRARRNLNPGAHPTPPSGRRSKRLPPLGEVSVSLPRGGIALRYADNLSRVSSPPFGDEPIESGITALLLRQINPSPCGSYGQILADFLAHFLVDLHPLVVAHLFVQHQLE